MYVCMHVCVCVCVCVCNWDSLHGRLSSHFKAWSYKKKKHKKIKAYTKSLYKEPTVNRCLFILDLQLFRSSVKGKHSPPSSSHIEQECLESLIQGKIQNQQNSNKGLKYS